MRIALVAAAATHRARAADTGAASHGECREGYEPLNGASCKSYGSLCAFGVCVSPPTCPATRPFKDGVASCDECAARCDAEGGACQSYECSATYLRCDLNPESVPEYPYNSRQYRVAIFRGRVAATPRPRRGYSAETSRGDAAAATLFFRGDEWR